MLELEKRYEYVEAFNIVKGAKRLLNLEQRSVSTLLSNLEKKLHISSKDEIPPVVNVETKEQADKLLQILRTKKAISVLFNEMNGVAICGDQTSLWCKSRNQPFFV
jgi:hypothetical protein